MQPDTGTWAEDAVAIVGMGCRFPGGADSPQAFWGLLEKGFNAITEAPASRPGFQELFDPDPKKPGRTYSRWGGFLDGVDRFDAQFFGISPREAAHIDPQHRLLLELVWEACEDAGLPPSKLAGSRTGVFIGISTHDYGDMQMYPWNRGDIDMHTNSGTATSIAANRISYLYDLRGPSVTIDTACSSSLSAVHFSCQSLRSGDCDLAIAGGVQILLAPELTIGFCKATMLSPDGQCRAFDAEANGYVRSEGAGVVILKPLRAALRDGDPVYAVIRATAINQDGHTTGMTVPSRAAQQSMIEEALAKAGIAPRDVQYVEAHGPGTPVGDPIEAAAIGAAMMKGRRDGELCAIGSVKTNLGHLEAASGMPGLIKVALSLQHRKIPPSLHFKRANDALDLQALRLRVVTELEPWPEPEKPAIAGVNSFGFGGANAHVLLQEAPPRVAAVPAAEPEISRLLAISARSPEALKSLAAAYAGSLRAADSPPIRDVCYTAAERRAHHDCRLSVVASRKEDFASYLTDFAAGASGVNVASGRTSSAGAPKIAFVFSGMGPQWWGMGRQLLASEPVFRRALERCHAALEPYAGWSLLGELSAEESKSRVALPELAQVTNFAIQVALAELWASLGITPQAVIGHSGGAMAAAYLAGVYSLEDAIRLTFHRSRLQGRPSNEGRMLAVGAPFGEIAGLLQGTEDRVSLAAVNGPSAITLAGDGDNLERVCAALNEKQIFARFLSVTIAYHSPVMEQIKDDFLASVAGLRGSPARIPLLSDTTGTWASGVECDALYWWRAIRQPVLFHDGIRTILQEGISHFVEISPHPVLVSSILDCMKEQGIKGIAVPSLRRAEEERAVILRSLGALYTVGCAPDWRALREEGARIAPLPRYPWQRERHWFEPAAKPNHWHEAMDRKAGDHPLLGVRLRSARPTWESLAGAGETEYLREHVVQGSAVFPGAAYVEMALATGTTVRDVEFLRPLLINPEGTPIQLALDETEGRFEVFSSADGTSWICHARGSVTAAKRFQDQTVDLEVLRQQFPDAVSTEEFYTRMSERGLDYGPVFRGVHSLWACHREALALISVPGVTDSASYRVHPALLDAAFQTLVAAADTDAELAAQTRLFLPTNIREVRFYATPGPKFYATAKLTEVAGASVSGDIRIVGENGQVCAEIVGLTARLVEIAGHGAQESVDQWLYDYRWEPQPREGSAGTTVLGPLPTAANLDEIRGRADALSVETSWRAYYDHVEKGLNGIAAAYIFEALADVLSAASAQDWRGSLARQLLSIIEDAGFVRSSGGEWEATGILPRMNAAGLTGELLRDYPDHRLDVELLRRCGPRLADVLAGRADGRDVLFTEEGFGFLEQFYRESPASAFYNALAANFVADLASGCSGTGALRVLEVGAGTGGTTSHILPRLAGRPAHYVFSDVSPLFLEKARAKFIEYPFLTTKLLDVSKDPTAQGFEPRSFDLVIAANVLHATPDVEPAVKRLRELLAPGGVLLLLEITRHPLWLDIVFGLMDGWWKFEDLHRRPSHPLMRGHQWRELLEECGLESAAVISDSVSGEPAQSMIVGGRPVETVSEESKHWLIFADEKRSVGRRLAAILGARGHRSSLIFPGNEVRPIAGEVAGVIHLWSLDTPPIDGPGAFEPAQALGCGSLLPILQNVILGSPLAERILVLVTAGAQTTGPEEEPAPLQTPIWGFGRVVRKEWPELRCRMIDLSAECLDQEVVALAEEILSDAETHVWEEEIALRAGARFVHRLRPTSLARIAEAAPPVPAALEDGWRAEIPTIGSLDSLVLRRFERPAPGPDQVEVAIHSASLNFRDVVVAMGAVRGLESEKTFGDRRLGFDLAGTVTRCGEAVGHLKPGDEVLGIAPGAFASYAVTNSVLVVRRPPRITMEQASTVAVAFVTAWYALGRLARLGKGETVLIHAASGGVGIAAIQIAKLAGARVFATVGSAAKRSFVEALGVEAVMDSRTLAFADEVRERTGGKGVDVVLNSLPGEAIERGFSALAPYGRFVELGKADIYQNHRIELGPFKRNLSFFAVDLDRMCIERPDFIGEMLREVVDQFASGALEPPPYSEFEMTKLADAMRFMAQAKHIGKVVIRNAGEVKVRAPIPERPPVRPDATYLITGGLGGLGLLVTRWLVERGARAVVLVGRSAPSLETGASLSELRANGVRIEAVAADVAQPRDVERTLDFIRANLPPLRGVLHAAMVLEDTALAELTADGLHRVMSPKVLGAWNLHAQTLGDPLDFFVSFSSITSLLGNPLQANYAAANAFLDSFAIYRRRRGLPATTINWGVISGSGYVARHPEVEEYLNRQGYLSFTPKQILDALSDLLRYDVPQVMAARIDWKRLGDFAPRAAASPRIRHLVPAGEGSPGHVVKGSIRASLEGENPAERPQRVELYLREQVSRLLGASPAGIDVDRPITDLGLDSLIAAELTVVLERDLDIKVAGARLLGGASVRALAQDILALLNLASPKAVPAQSWPAPEDTHNNGIAIAPSLEEPAGEPVDYTSLDYSHWSRAQRAIKAVTTTGFKFLARVKTQGMENIPRQGPCLLVVNHLSMADVPLVLTLLPRRAIILAVDELKAYRMVDWFVSDMGQAIYLAQNQADQQPLQKALTVLKANGLLALAPEGSRSKTGLLRGQTGVAYLATRADVPVVPLVAWGQEKWRDRWKRIRRIPIQVRIGAPLRFPQGNASPMLLRQYTDEIMARLAAMLPPEYRGVYAGAVEEPAGKTQSAVSGSAR